MQLYDKYRRIFRGHPIRNHLRVHKDDTFLVSYPRSGNTWIRFLLGTAISGKGIDWHNFETVIPDIYRNTHQQLEALPRPRIIKSHHSYDKRYPKVIYIVRDVRDVFISYYNFHNKFPGRNSNLTIEDYLERFLTGELDDFGTWSSNIASWINNQNKIENGFLILRFEDLLSNTRAELVRILEFLGLDKTNDDIDNAIKWASFGNMRRLENEQQNASFFRQANKNLKFTNKGKKGGWREALSEEQLSRLVKANDKYLKQFKYI